MSADQQKVLNPSNKPSALSGKPSSTAEVKDSKDNKDGKEPKEMKESKDAKDMAENKAKAARAAIEARLNMIQRFNLTKIMASYVAYRSQAHIVALEQSSREKFVDELLKKVDESLVYVNARGEEVRITKENENEKYAALLVDIFHLMCQANKNSIRTSDPKTLAPFFTNLNISFPDCLKSPQLHIIGGYYTQYKIPEDLRSKLMLLGLSVVREANKRKISMREIVLSLFKHIFSEEIISTSIRDTNDGWMFDERFAHMMSCTLLKRVTLIDFCRKYFSHPYRIPYFAASLSLDVPISLCRYEPMHDQDEFHELCLEPYTYWPLTNVPRPLEISCCVPMDCYKSINNMDDVYALGAQPFSPHGDFMCRDVGDYYRESRGDTWGVAQGKWCADEPALIQAYLKLRNQITVSEPSQVVCAYEGGLISRLSTAKVQLSANPSAQAFQQQSANSNNQSSSASGSLSLSAGSLSQSPGQELSFSGTMSSLASLRATASGQSAGANSSTSAASSAASAAMSTTVSTTDGSVSANSSRRPLVRAKRTKQ